MIARPFRMSRPISGHAWVRGAAASRYAHDYADGSDIEDLAFVEKPVQVSLTSMATEHRARAQMKAQRCYVSSRIDRCCCRHVLHETARAAGPVLRRAGPGRSQRSQRR